MLKLIRDVAEWGIRPDAPAEEAHRFRLTNVLFLFMFFASIFQTAACFVVGNVEAGTLNSTAPIVFGCGLMLMKRGHHVAARVGVLGIAYSAGYAMVASLGPESYFQFIYLFSSAFALIVFSTKEKLLLTLGLITPLVFFALLEITNYEPVFGMSQKSPSGGQLVFMRLISIGLVWLMMTLHFLYSIRARVRLQQQLISSAKMVAMARMAAGIAHEVNNPLQLIVSYADRLKGLAGMTASSTDQIAMVADKIQSVAMRIAAINKGLLGLSRDASGDPFENVSVRSIILLALDFSRARIESQEIEVRFKEPPREWAVIGRETQLSEVLLNVLNNASDALEDQVEKWIEIETEAERDWILVTVTDSGPGVVAQFHNKIFDPFFTTKPSAAGTGLGLSLSRAIMSAHGGRIEFEPVAAGARFRIRFPRGSELTETYHAIDSDRDSAPDGNTNL